ncbi:MAG: sulfite exporter TauE/SafE family protein [Thermoanaerobaculia bacterium]
MSGGFGSSSGLLAMFAAGLLSSGHCFGMCGGIAGALALRSRRQGPAGVPLPIVLHSAGRISTYALLGLLAGAVGGVLAAPFPVEAATGAGRILAALSFTGVALFLLGRPNWLAPLERLGGRLYRAVEPLRRRLPLDGSRVADYLYGITWGFLPCGLVYAAVAIAVTAGSAMRGALAMLAFGAGTLPALLLAGSASRVVARWTQGATVRRLAAAMYLVAAVLLLASASRHGGSVSQGLAGPVCHPTLVSEAGTAR